MSIKIWVVKIEHWWRYRLMKSSRFSIRFSYGTHRISERFHEKKMRNRILRVIFEMIAPMTLRSLGIRCVWCVLCWQQCLLSVLWFVTILWLCLMIRVCFLIPSLSSFTSLWTKILQLIKFQRRKKNWKHSSQPQNGSQLSGGLPKICLLSNQVGSWHQQKCVLVITKHWSCGVK